MGLYILIFEVFIIVFYGIFVRTGSATTSTFSDLEAPLYFTLAYTLLTMRFRMYDWSQLTNYLFIVALCFQMNTLYIMFWQSCFYSSFSSTTNISSLYLIINIQCILAVLVTTFQFTGRFTIPQIFVLCMVEVFAFALNFSINQFGVKAITAGGTMTIFLFGYLFAVPIKKLCCQQDLQNPDEQRQRYFTMILRVIGLVVIIILWPNFTSTTALVDSYYLPQYGNISSTTAYLSVEGFLHMILGFIAAIGTTIGLRIMGERIILQRFINTLFLTGVFLSSSAAVIIDPFASLLMGVLAPLLSYLIERFFPGILIKGYPIEGIIFASIGGIFDAIFTAGRNNRTPTLANDCLQQGGLQFACLIISVVFSLLFGLLTAVLLRCFNPKQSVNKDGTFWFIDQENLPIYPDDPILKRIVGADSTSKAMRQEQALFNLKQAYITEKNREKIDMGKIVKQTVDVQSRIR